jgi:putative DNA primase/helicase
MMPSDYIGMPEQLTCSSPAAQLEVGRSGAQALEEIRGDESRGDLSEVPPKRGQFLIGDSSRRNRDWLTASEVHGALRGRWPATLAALGVLPESALRRKFQNKPCPACGGRDRFTFDDRYQRGDWLCRSCGSGDGFDLLRAVHGWSLRESMAEVLRLEGIDPARLQTMPPSRSTAAQAESKPATPSARALDLLRTATEAELVPDVRSYLEHRRVWPLPQGHSLRAHSAAPYYGEAIPPELKPAYIGRFAALLAPVLDVDGALVTVHATYLQHGRKLEGHEPRKLLSALTGRTGCAVRLAPLGPVLGIAEGIETALAAMQRHRVPVWAALNAAMLAKFTPPPGVQRLAIFADRDVAGLRAAWTLRDRTAIPCELHVPREGFKDWADVLSAEVQRHG